MRSIKLLKFTMADIGKDCEQIERKVNKEIEEIVSHRGKIVTIQTETFGLSPMTLLFIIIFEVKEDE